MTDPPPSPSTSPSSYFADNLARARNDLSTPSFGIAGLLGHALPFLPGHTPRPGLARDEELKERVSQASSDITAAALIAADLTTKLGIVTAELKEAVSKASSDRTAAALIAADLTTKLGIVTAKLAVVTAELAVVTAELKEAVSKASSDTTAAALSTADLSTKMGRPVVSGPSPQIQEADQGPVPRPESPGSNDFQSHASPMGLTGHLVRAFPSLVGRNAQTTVSRTATAVHFGAKDVSVEVRAERIVAPTGNLGDPAQASDVSSAEAVVEPQEPIVELYDVHEEASKRIDGTRRWALDDESPSKSGLEDGMVPLSSISNSKGSSSPVISVRRNNPYAATVLVDDGQNEPSPPVVVAVLDNGLNPQVGSVPVYRSHEKWKESHVMAITAPFNGKTADYVIRGCLPFLLSAHAAARSPQWGTVLEALQLPREALMELTKHIDAIWSTAAPTLPATSYLSMPLFAYGAGSVMCLPNGESNPIASLRHHVQFQFRGVISVGEDGVERRSATQYSDVLCRDHIPGVKICRRPICRFAHYCDYGD